MNVTDYLRLSRDMQMCDRQACEELLRLNGGGSSLLDCSAAVHVFGVLGGVEGSD